MTLQDSKGKKTLKIAGGGEEFKKEKTKIAPEDNGILFPKCLRKITVRLKFSPHVNYNSRVRTKTRHLKTKRLKQFSISRTW